MTVGINHPSALSTQSRIWQPAPVVRISILLHGVAFMALVAQPSAWPWLLAGLILNHLILIAAVLDPTGQLLGPNLTRLPDSARSRREVAMTFDDGPDPAVTPRVLDLLDEYQAKASFFCIGAKAAAHPDLVREIVRRGHDVENHSFRHSHAFAFYGVTGMQREVEKAQSTLTGIAGKAPVFFRAPAGFRSPMLDIIMARCGLHYASWTRRGLDGVRSDPATVLQRLTRNLAAGDVLMLHDVARDDAAEPVVLGVLPQLLQQLAAKNLKSVTLTAAFIDESIS